MIHTLALLIAAASSAPPAPACNAAAAFTGTICAPAGPGKHPAIVLLGGSEGGDMMSHAAPTFAQHGYLAASVAYFGLPGLPQTLEDVPVETIGKAIQAVAARADVDPNRIAIMGISKGGELALLTASLYPQIHAVIAGVPSPFAWEGIAQGAGPPESSWTYNGKPLPYVAYGTAMGQQFSNAFTAHAPLDLRKGYDGAMQENAAQIAPAMFKLEQIKGPVLLVAAGDDQIWDSVRQSQMALQYLQAHHHAYADKMIQYPQAGHIFLFATPQRPMTSTPLGPLTMLLGGTAQANVQAAAKAWPEIFTFLGSALK